MRMRGSTPDGSDGTGLYYYRARYYPPDLGASWHKIPLGLRVATTYIPSSEVIRSREWIRRAWSDRFPWGEAALSGGILSCQSRGRLLAVESA